MCEKPSKAVSDMVTLDRARESTDRASGRREELKAVALLSIIRDMTTFMTVAAGIPCTVKFDRDVCSRLSRGGREKKREIN